MLVVRAAQPADHNKLAELLAELLAEPTLTPELKSALNTNLLRLLSTSNATLLIAEILDKIVGFASLWNLQGLFTEGSIGIIDSFVVSKDVVGKDNVESNLAKTLLEQALGVFQALGCSQVKVLPSENNMTTIASQLLIEFGFQNMGNTYYLEIY